MKHALSSLLAITGVLVASVASADGAQIPAAPHPQAAAPVKAAPAPKAPAAPHVASAPKATPKIAAKIVVGGKHAAPGEKVVPVAEQESAPIPGVPFIRPKSSDPGITIVVDPAKARVRVSGTAEGARLVDYMGRETRNEDDASYGVARGVSFDVDKFEMPDFSKDRDYSRKNKWYFAHLATVDTHRGDSAMVVATRLAESLSKGRAYDAKVTQDDEGAVIEITKR